MFIFKNFIIFKICSPSNSHMCIWDGIRMEKMILLESDKRESSCDAWSASVVSTKVIENICLM